MQYHLDIESLNSKLNQGDTRHEKETIHNRTDHCCPERSRKWYAVIKELCWKYGMSEATLYNWKNKYGGMMVREAKRLKELEEENRRLKKLLADQALDIQMLKEITTKKW